jgi:hypothetical protein
LTTDYQVFKKDMDNDKELREKFSRVLGAPISQRGMYGVSDDKQSVYSWEEIFTEIGKLLQRANTPKIEYITREKDPLYNYPKQKNPLEPHYHGNGIPCWNNPCLRTG